MRTETKAVAEKEEAPAMKDVLLQSFTKAQKEYIIEKLYPDLGKAL